MNYREIDAGFGCKEANIGNSFEGFYSHCRYSPLDCLDEADRWVNALLKMNFHHIIFGNSPLKVGTL
jgi:hypothetical protein